MKPEELFNHIRTGDQGQVQGSFDNLHWVDVIEYLNQFNLIEYIGDLRNE